MGKYVERGKSAPHIVAEDDPLALRLLKEEHQVFRELFDRAEDSEEDDERLEIAREICLRLGVHMTIEEEILYPALEGVIEEDEVKEGIVEHASGKALAAEIEQLNGTEPLFQAKVHVLGEETMHHVEEEDTDMFEDAKKAHQQGRIDLDEVGARLQARRQELYDRIAETGEEGETGDVDADEVSTV